MQKSAQLRQDVLLEGRALDVSELTALSVVVEV
jgi:hypothetical protein